MYTPRGGCHLLYWTLSLPLQLWNSRSWGRGSSSYKDNNEDIKKRGLHLWSHLPMGLGVPKCLFISHDLTRGWEALGRRTEAQRCWNLLMTLVATRASAQSNVSGSSSACWKRAVLLNFYLKVSFLKWNIVETHENGVWAQNTPLRTHEGGAWSSLSKIRGKKSTFPTRKIPTTVDIQDRHHACPATRKSVCNVSIRKHFSGNYILSLTRQAFRAQPGWRDCNTEILVRVQAGEKTKTRDPATRHSRGDPAPVNVATVSKDLLCGPSLTGIQGNRERAELRVRPPRVSPRSQ
jgi:hypothetical protein